LKLKTQLDVTKYSLRV